MLIILVLLLYLIIPEVILRPSYSKNDYGGRQHHLFDKTLEEYLTQFGYLAPSNALSLRSHDYMMNAVKNLQFYAGINITGVIDDATVDLITRYYIKGMKMPRFFWD